MIQLRFSFFNRETGHDDLWTRSSRVSGVKSAQASKIMSAIIFLLTFGIVFSSTPAVAEVSRYRLGQDSLVNTGKDNGYSEAKNIDKDDSHWGWNIGEFYVTGFTRPTKSNDGNPEFLKNVGDKVVLWFNLGQNIDSLNGNENLTISEDKNGWDQKFQVEQQNFGRGMLIVKHTNYLNEAHTSLYSDFLTAASTETAATKVEVFEEGDYEVALDYEIKQPRFGVYGWEPMHSFSNYQTTFKFSVRNGNSMVFPFDVVTDEQLKNGAHTVNGFRLDLVKSRYLDIDIRREVLNDGSDGLVEDTRFNRPARDGSQYTDEGVYTITVRNPSTGEQTVKSIYVGADDLLKAHAATGLSISEIDAMLADGAVIADNGTIIPLEGSRIEVDLPDSSEPADASPESGEEEATSTVDGTLANSDSAESSSTPKLVGGIVLGFILFTAFAASIFAWRRRHKSLKESELS